MCSDDVGSLDVNTQWYMGFMVLKLNSVLFVVCF